MSHEPYLQSAADDETSTLQYQIEVGRSLSLESKTQAFVNSVKSTLDLFLGKVGEFLTGLKIGNYKPRRIDLGKTGRLIQEEGYAEARNRPVTVPPGFSAKYVDYLKDVNTVLPAIYNLEKSLKVTIAKLAAILNEPDRLKAQSGIRELEKQLVLATPEQLDALKAHYKNGVKTQVLLSAVVGRLADLDYTVKEVDLINRELAKVDFVAIRSQIQRLANLVLILRDTLQQEEHSDPSGIVVSQLSDTFYRMGVTATLASVVADGIGQLSDSLNSWNEASA